MAPDQHRDRAQFLQLIARLRGVAEKHGDRVFADALGDCLLDSSHGDQRCPVVDLLLREYAETGQPPPRAEGEHPLQPVPLNYNDPPPYDRQHFIDYLHHVLEVRAAFKGDTAYVQALHACQKAMRESDACPMGRFLKQHYPNP